MDHHLIALTALAGMTLDMLGGLFLAYDLLGQRRGPLRTLLRVALYTGFFAMVYASALGVRFGICAGIGLGLALAYELRCAEPSRAVMHPVFRRIGLALFRGTALGLGAAWTFSAPFGWWLGLLSTVGLIVAYWLRFSPADAIEKGTRPHLSAKKIQGSAVRGLLMGLAGTLAGLIAPTQPSAMRVGLEVGLTVGLVGVTVGALSPFIEWYTDELPAQRLGLFGIVLIGAGMVLQSVQYWVAVFDVAVR